MSHRHNDSQDSIQNAPVEHDNLLVDASQSNEKPAIKASTSTLSQSSPPGAGPSRRIGLAAILPGLVAVIVSWVLATAILAWLFSKRVTDHPATENQFFKGALVAVEKAAAPKHNADGSVIPESTMYGLTISSLGSTIIPITVPLLMGIYAYHVASDWLRAQSAGRLNNVPTPSQYALMVSMCSAGGIGALKNYAAFFWKPLPSEAAPTAVLKRCIMMLVMLMTFNYAIAGADLWFHSRATAFIHSRFTPMSSNDFDSYQIGSAINTTLCPGPYSLSEISDQGVTSSTGTGYNCQDVIFSPAGGGTASINSWGSEPEMIGESVTTMRGQYSSNEIYLIDDLAIISRPNIATTIDGATFDTLGMKATCQPANCTNAYNGPGSGTITCADFSPPFTYAYNGVLSVNNTLMRFNVADRSFIPEAQYSLNSSINPSGVLVVIEYVYSQNVAQGRAGGGDSMPGWLSEGDSGDGHADMFFAECTATVYNVKVQLSNIPSQSFSLVSDPVMADFNTTSAMTPAFETTTSLAQTMVNFLHDTFEYTDVSNETDFLTTFSRNLSVAALSLASPIVMNQPLSAGSFIDLISASRYEWAPLFFYTGLLYIYGLIALLLSISVALARSPTIIHDNQEIKTAQLLQLRLKDPMVLVADRYLDGQSQSSFEQTAVAMYRAAPDEQPRRLAAVVSGDDGSLRRRNAFGVDFLGDHGDADDAQLQQIQVLSR